MTETDPKPRKLNEVDDVLRDRLNALLESIDVAADYLEVGCSPGSDFVNDHQVFTSRSPFDAGSLILWSVLDHLRFVAKGVLGGDRLTAFAPFTVVRTALTAATLASWMLSENADERRFRTLVVTYEELRNKRNALKMIAEAPDRTDVTDVADYNTRRESARRELVKLDAEVDKIKADAASFGVAFTAVRDGKPQDGQIVEAGAELIASDKHYYDPFGKATETKLMWRTLSSHAHGFSWAAAMTSVVTQHPDGREMNAFDPQAADLLVGLQVVWDVFTGVLARFATLAGMTRTDQVGA